MIVRCVHVAWRLQFDTVLYVNKLVIRCAGIQTHGGETESDEHILAVSG